MTGAGGVPILRRAVHVGKYYPPYYGGMEQFLADLLPALKRIGVVCAAVVHEHRRRGTDIAVDRITVSDSADSVCERPAQETPYATPVYRVPSFGEIAYAPVSPQFPLWLNRAIRQHNCQILHLHMPNTSAFWALTLPNAARLPIVVHWHSDVLWPANDRRLRVLYRLYRPFETALLRRADKIVCTSPPYLKASAPLARWRTKCCIVPLGLAPQRIPHIGRRDREEAEKLWGNAKFRVLSVGRLTYYKGHEYLIEAAQALEEARIILVGGGRRQRFLAQMAENHRVADRVVFAGSLSQMATHALMETSDCVCLPSVERTEAFGLVLLEAMVHAKPTIVSDIPGSGVGWVAEHERSGLLVPPKDVAALRSALATLMNNPDAAKRMGNIGKKRFEGSFTIDRIGKQIEEIYQELA